MHELVNSGTTRVRGGYVQFLPRISGGGSHEEELSGRSGRGSSMLYGYEYPLLPRFPTGKTPPSWRHSDLEEIVVDGDDLLEETPQQIVSALLPLTIHPSPSLSTLRRRHVNSDSTTSQRRESQELETCHEPDTNLVRRISLNTPSPSPMQLLSHINFNTLNVCFCRPQATRLHLY